MLNSDRMMKSPKSSARGTHSFFPVFIMEGIPTQPVQLSCACQAKALQFEADLNELSLRFTYHDPKPV